MSTTCPRVNPSIGSGTRGHGAAIFAEHRACVVIAPLPTLRKMHYPAGSSPTFLITGSAGSEEKNFTSAAAVTLSFTVAGVAPA